MSKEKPKISSHIKKTPLIAAGVLGAALAGSFAAIDGIQSQDSVKNQTHAKIERTIGGDADNKIQKLPNIIEPNSVEAQAISTSPAGENPSSNDVQVMRNIVVKARNGDSEAIKKLQEKILELAKHARQEIEDEFRQKLAIEGRVLTEREFEDLVANEIQEGDLVVQALAHILKEWGVQIDEVLIFENAKLISENLAILSDDALLDKYLQKSRGPLFNIHDPEYREAARINLKINIIEQLAEHIENDDPLLPLFLKLLNMNEAAFLEMLRTTIAFLRTQDITPSQLEYIEKVVRAYGLD